MSRFSHKEAVPQPSTGRTKLLSINRSPNSMAWNKTVVMRREAFRALEEEQLSALTELPCGL